MFSLCHRTLRGSKSSSLGAGDSTYAEVGVRVSERLRSKLGCHYKIISALRQPDARLRP